MARRRKKKRWSELPPQQRTAIVAVGIVQVALQIAALIDLWRRPREQIRGNKPLWTALSFLNFFGPLAYFKVGRRRSPT